MSEFINVPVPTHLVTAVMKFIADQGLSESSGSDRSPRMPTEFADDETDYSRNWTRSQMQLLNDSDKASVKLFGQVLSILADASPNPIPTEKLGELVGLRGLTMQNTFGPVTKWMRNRIGGDGRWPMHFPEGGWAMNEHNARIWKDVTS